MRILLDVGKANVNAKKNDSTRLSTIPHWQVIEAATLLIERGAEINPIDETIKLLLIGHMCSITQP